MCKYKERFYRNIVTVLTLKNFPPPSQIMGFEGKTGEEELQQ